MSLPFPGMDPYLEHPALWTSVHARLMVVMATQLKPLIRPRYVATVEERVYFEGTEQQRVPDVSVHNLAPSREQSSSAIGLMDTPLVVDVEQLETREHYIEILDRHQAMRVVTVIEVVSPSTKMAGPGRRSYQAKQQETLASEAHFVEIDLLRRGRHVVAVSEASVRALGTYQYLACVSRWPARKRSEVYLRTLRDRLPRIRMPLAAPDADVPLDVQTALERVYDDGDYILRIPYDRPCEPALEPADQQWVNEHWAAYRAAHPELFPNAGARNDAGPA